MKKNRYIAAVLTAAVLLFSASDFRFSAELNAEEENEEYIFINSSEDYGEILYTWNNPSSIEKIEIIECQPYELGYYSIKNAVTKSGIIYTIISNLKGIEFRIRLRAYHFDGTYEDAVFKSDRNSGVISTDDPTCAPTASPTMRPTAAPTAIPTCEPTENPSYEPSYAPGTSDPETTTAAATTALLGTTTAETTQPGCACTTDTKDPGNSDYPIGTVTSVSDQEADHAPESVTTSAMIHTYLDFYEMNDFGDLNSDAKVDLLDLTILSLYMIGDYNFTNNAEYMAADVMYDYDVNLADLARLKQYISKVKGVSLGPSEKIIFSR